MDDFMMDDFIISECSNSCESDYQGALDRISSIDLDRVLETIYYDYEAAELISDYGISSYPNLEMSGDIKTLQNLIDSSKLNNLALELACKELNKITGSCPLGVCDYDLDCEKRCQEYGTGEFSVECWMKYFKKKAEN